MMSRPRVCACCGSATRELFAHFPVVVVSSEVELLCGRCEAGRRAGDVPPPGPEIRLAVAVARAAALFGEEPTYG